MIDKIIEITHGGGFVAYPLIAGCALLGYGISQRLLFLRRGNGKQVDTLMGENSVVENTEFMSLISRIKRSSTQVEREVILSDAQEYFSQFGTLITTVVMIAPLLGLLGTVSGMIETFASLGDGALHSQSGGIAGGISTALISTQMGLAVAIPGLVIGRVLMRKQQQLMNDLEQAKEIKSLEGVSHA